MPTISWQVGSTLEGKSIQVSEGFAAWLLSNGHVYDPQIHEKDLQNFHASNGIDLHAMLLRCSLNLGELYAEYVESQWNPPRRWWQLRHPAPHSPTRRLS